MDLETVIQRRRPPEVNTLTIFDDEENVIDVGKKGHFPKRNKSCCSTKCCSLYICLVLFIILGIFSFIFLNEIKDEYERFSYNEFIEILFGKKIDENQINHHDKMDSDHTEQPKISREKSKKIDENQINHHDKIDSDHIMENPSNPTNIKSKNEPSKEKIDKNPPQKENEKTNQDNEDREKYQKKNQNIQKDNKEPEITKENQEKDEKDKISAIEDDLDEIDVKNVKNVEKEVQQINNKKYKSKRVEKSKDKILLRKEELDEIHENDIHHHDSEDDDHHLELIDERKDLFFTIKSLFDSGKISDKQSYTLVHFSSHPDLEVPRKLNLKMAYNPKLLKKIINNRNYIMSLVYFGYISKVIWIKPGWIKTVGGGRYTVKIGNVKGENDKIAVNRRDIFDYVTCYSKNLKNTKKLSLEIMNLQSFYQKTRRTRKKKMKSFIQNSEHKIPSTTPLLNVHTDYFGVKSNILGLKNYEKSYVDLLTRWKISNSYCNVDNFRISKKIKKFFNGMYESKKKLNLKKHMIKSILPYWCLGKKKGNKYFNLIKKISDSSKDHLSLILKGDSAHAIPNPKKLKRMTNHFKKFIKTLFSQPSLRGKKKIGKPTITSINLYARRYLKILETMFNEDEKSEEIHETQNIHTNEPGQYKHDYEYYNDND